MTLSSIGLPHKRSKTVNTRLRSSLKKTTTYDYKTYDHDDKELLISRKITVTDKNGVEIKEEELKNYQERKEVNNVNYFIKNQTL